MQPAPTLYLLCGLPGAGKTTLAKQIEAESRAVRLCPDDWMQALDASLWDEDLRAKIESLQWSLGRRLLALGVSVVVEWGTWAESERTALRQDAETLGARTEIHVLDPPVEVMIERIEARKLEDPPITREQILDWSTLFQRPSPDELALYTVARIHGHEDIPV